MDLAGSERVAKTGAAGGTLDAEAFPCSYPDESHDAESLFWADGALHIITKQLTTVSQVFRLPPLGDGNLVAEELLGAFLPPEGVLAVTGADAGRGVPSAGRGAALAASLSPSSALSRG